MEFFGKEKLGRGKGVTGVAWEVGSQTSIGLQRISIKWF